MTAQFSDSIMYKGELYGIANEPFEAFLKNRPDIKFRDLCSACWRGYLADWEILEDKLYLIGLKEFVMQNDIARYNFNDIFPGMDKVFAEWYTGEVKIELGETIENVRSRRPIFESEVILTIEKGIIVEEREVDNRGKVFEEDKVIKMMSKDLKKPSWCQKVKMFFLKGVKTIN